LGHRHIRDDEEDGEQERRQYRPGIVGDAMNDAGENGERARRDVPAVVAIEAADRDA
jgi:hypothetical protein